MKRSLALATLLASGLALSAAAQTQPAPAAGPSKIAVVAFQVAAGPDQRGRAQLCRPEEEVRAREAQLKAQDDEIQSLTSSCRPRAQP